MAEVATQLGKVCVTPKGAWSSGTAYAVLDIVTNGGGSYLAKKDVPAGTALSNTTYWLNIVEKGAKGDTATIAVGSTTTGAEGTNASVTNSGTSTDGVFDFVIPRGNTGNGIASIEKTGSTLNVDHYKITFTDGDEFTYDVTNASSGVWGSITGDLEDQTDLVEELDNKADVITVNASGDIVSISDGSPHPVKGLNVDVTAAQDLHGYDAPWPAGGSANIYDPSKYVAVGGTGNTVSLSGETYSVTWTSGALIFRGKDVQTFPAGTYTLSAVGTNLTNLRIALYRSADDSVVTNDKPFPHTFTSDAEFYIGIYGVSTASTKSSSFSMALKSGSDSTYSPYANICPISGWTQANVTRTAYNVWGGEKMADDMVLAVNNATYCTKGTDADGNYVSMVGSAAISDVKMFSKFKPNTQYTFIFKLRKSNENAGINLMFVYTDGTQSGIIMPSTPVIGEIYNFAITSTVGKSIACIAGLWASGSAYLYYDSCGIFEGVHTVDEFAPYQGTTVTIPFGQTVYGAEWDALAGTMTVTHASVDLGTLTWTIASGVGAYSTKSDMATTGSVEKYDITCSAYPSTTWSATACAIAHFNSIIRISNPAYLSYTAEQWKTALSGVTAVYPLATPVVITGLTPAILNTLLGDNNIWADCGAVDVDYRADTGLYVDRKIASAVGAVKRIITTTTTEMKAPKNLTSGEIVIVGDDLYKAITNIASGATLTVGTNVAKVTLAEWVASLVA